MITDRRNLFEKMDPIVRHPFILTFIAFILSGLIGTWLTERYQREQHEQDAIRKNMDEVRLSIDSTNQAFDDFLDSASTLDDALTLSADDKRLEADREIFWKSKRDLDSKLAIETPRLRQAMPLGTGAAFQLSTSLMRIGAARITECLNYGKVVEVNNAKPNRRRVECKNNNLLSIKYADEQISKVQLCVSEFYFAVRPSPSDDLHPERVVDYISRAISNLGAVCNDVTMLGLPYNSTYGKYKIENK